MSSSENIETASSIVSRYSSAWSFSSAGISSSRMFSPLSPSK